MKSFFCLFATLLIVITGLSACSSDDNEVKEDVLKVSPTSINVSEAAQEASVEIEASSNISVTISDRSWCIYEIAGQKTTQTTYVFHIAQNTKKESRQTTFTIVCGLKTQKVTITQAASTAVEPEHEIPDTPSTGSVAFAKNMGLGWNLGNQMDAWSNEVANETCWGNKACSQATMDAVKNAGITTVRIPVTWLGKVGEAPDYKIDEAWLNRVAEIVGYAKNAGLNAIINIHHDGADSKHWLDIKKAAKDANVNTEITAKIKAIWSQIAVKFKNEGDYLIFEAFNEIQDGGWGWGDNRNDGGKQYKTLNGWNQAFVDAVREVGGKNAERYLGIPPYNTNIDIASQSDFVLPKDPTSDHLLIAVHNYDPYLYTLEAQFGEWGHTSTIKDTQNKENEITNAFKKLTNSFISKGLGVYVGEFGCVNRKSEREKAFQKYYLEYYVKAAKDAGVPCILWDNGSTSTGKECHGFFNHASGAYIGYAEDVIKAMVNAWTNEDNTYTLQSVYNSAPK